MSVYIRYAQAARGLIEGEGLSDRCEVISGDYFDAVPKNVDLYMFKCIMCDWDDDRAIAILKNCRDGIAPGGRVLIIDIVIPADISDGRYPMTDIRMLVLTGGHVRTEAGYRDLYSGAGFKLSRIIPTSTPWSLVEGLPV